MSAAPVAWALIRSYKRGYNREHRRDFTDTWRAVDRLTPKRVFMSYPGNFDRTKLQLVKRSDHRSFYRHTMIAISEGPTEPSGPAK